MRASAPLATAPADRGLQVELTPDQAQLDSAARDSGPPRGLAAALDQLKVLVPHFAGYTITTELGRAEELVREVLSQGLTRVHSHLESALRLLERGADWEGLEGVESVVATLANYLEELSRPPPELGAVPPDTEVSPAQQEALYEWELTLTDRLASCQRHAAALLELADSGGTGALEVELQACREALDYFGHDWRRRQEQFAGLAMGS